jgi:integrase
MAKRNSWGAIRKLPHNGRFQASYIAPDGFRHNGPDTFRTKTDASTYLAGVRADISEGRWVDPKSVTASAEIPEFLAFAKAHINKQTTRGGEHLRKSTKAVYLRQLEGHCRPFFGLPVDKITKQMIDELYSTIAASGKRTTASKIYKLLSSIFKRAIDYKYLEENPCSIKGANYASSRKKVSTPKKDQVCAIVEAMNPRFKFLVLLCAYGGFRFGEATELRRKDVEVAHENGERRYKFNVERAVTFVAGGFVVDRPKSARSVRKVIVPIQINLFVEKYLENMEDKDPEALLFCNSSAKKGIDPHIRHDVVAKNWVRALKRAGIEDEGITFHSLRHFAGTTYHEAGATIPNLMEWLGDSSIASIQRYLHPSNTAASVTNKMDFPTELKLFF